MIVNAIEHVLTGAGVVFRKDHILKILFPKKYLAFLKKLGDDPMKTRRFVNKNYTLFDLFDKLGAYQDEINASEGYREFTPEFVSYDQYMEQQTKILTRLHNLREKSEKRRQHFYDVVYPLVFRSIRTSIFEYQASPEMVGELLNA